MDLLARIHTLFSDSIQAKIAAADALPDSIAKASEVMVKCLIDNGKILSCGNGGSACDSQHFSSKCSIASSGNGQRYRQLL